MQRFAAIICSVFMLASGVFAREAPSSASPQLRGVIGVGGVTGQSARFRVQLDSPGQVAIEASADRSFSKAIRGDSATASAPQDYVVLLNVNGLASDTRYYYRAVINGTPDEQTGSFLTFPPDGSVTTFTFAFGSCQENGVGHSSDPPGKVFGEVARAHPRFFLQIGDWGYPDTTDNLPTNTDVFSADYGRVQGSYRSKFSSAYLMDTLLGTAPVDYVYDDHDYMGNNASAASVPFTIAIKPNDLSSDFVARDIAAPNGTRGNSMRGYMENMPTYPLPNTTRGIYHSFRYGNAELFMLDLRSQRSPNLEGFQPADSGVWRYTPPAGHSILGRTAAIGDGESQFSWLLNGLKNSTATWKFLVSSVPFNRRLGEVINLGLRLQDSIYVDPRLPAGTRAIAASFEIADKWAGFPGDLDSLLSFIRINRIKNVIVLSGDAHTAAMDDGVNAGLPEIMAGGLDIPNSMEAWFLAALGLPIWNRGGQGLSTPAFDNAFGKVTVFGEDSVRLALVDENGIQFASYILSNGVTGIAERAAAVPGAYRLEQNYPNPFNPATTIAYEVPGETHVRLAVYDLLGREVSVLVDERQEAGRHAATFDARTLASGVYVYRLTAGGYRSSRKMLVLR